MINFPDNPTPGQRFNSVTGALYEWDGVAWNIVSGKVTTADDKNLIVNPGLWVSQENGAAVLTTSGTYPVDQFLIGFATTGAVSAQQVQTPPASKSPSPYRVRIIATTADTSLTTNEYCQLYTPIEGSRCAALRWGTAEAKQAIVRFGFKGPAGTYSIRLCNTAGTRSCVAQFTISAAQANIETEQVLVVPGDTVGTWATDTTIGIQLGIIFAAGPSYVGVTGWQGGNILAGPGQSNGLAVINNTFEIWDVGLYADPNNTGLPPPYVPPTYDEAYMDCLRYWQRYGGLLNFTSYVNVAGGQIITPYLFVRPLRVTPQVAFSGLSYANANTISANAVADKFVMVEAKANAAGNAYVGFVMVLNARM